MSLGGEDEGGFTLRLLHFRRTFVEKMFAIHTKVELFKRDSGPSEYARHYYDLFQLAARQEVSRHAAIPGVRAIKADYDQISRAHFPKSYFYPKGMTFAGSDALFPLPELAAIIGPEYERQCKALCYGHSRHGPTCRPGLQNSADTCNRSCPTDADILDKSPGDRSRSIVTEVRFEKAAGDYLEGTRLFCAWQFKREEVAGA